MDTAADEIRSKLDWRHYPMPVDREQRARIIGEWLQTEARFLAS